MSQSLACKSFSLMFGWFYREEWQLQREETRVGGCWLRVKFGNDSARPTSGHISSEEDKAKEKR